MWVPTRPAGCGPENSTCRSRSSPGHAIPEAGDVHRKRYPLVSLATTRRPRSNASAASAMITDGSGASGLVSIAVTNMAAGCVPGDGILLNGRLRNAVQSPDANRLSRTVSIGMSGNCSASNDAKVSASSPSSRMTTDCSARLAPRFIAVTSPAPGAVKRTSGFPLSIKSSWPRRTRWPSSTVTLGRKPM